jgi:hypothetical protein
VEESSVGLIDDNHRVGTKENQGKLSSVSDQWVKNRTEYSQIQVRCFITWNIVRDFKYIVLYCLLNDAGSTLCYNESNDGVITVIKSLRWRARR